MPKFKLTDEQYAIIKWAVQIVMPALGVFGGVVGGVLEWSYTDSVLTIWTALTVLLGTCLGVSSYNYNKGDDIDE